jgi:hypothetical protein
MKRAWISKLKSQIKCKYIKKTLNVINAKNRLKDFRIICFVKFARPRPFTANVCKNITICMEISAFTVSNAEFY